MGRTKSQISTAGCLAKLYRASEMKLPLHKKPLTQICVQVAELAYHEQSLESDSQQHTKPAVPHLGLYGRSTPPEDQEFMVILRYIGCISLKPDWVT